MSNFMGSQEYLTEINSEIRKKFLERNEAERKLKRINRSIAKLSFEKNNLENAPPIKMSDEEFLYTIQYCLKGMTPASKAFEACSQLFGKDAEWGKRIVRCRPLHDQLDRVINELEDKSCHEYFLIKEHGLLDMRDIRASKTFSAMLRKLKLALKIAKKIHERDACIKGLEEKVISKNREIEALKQALARSLSLDAKQRVLEIRRLFPQKNISEIAKMVHLSRQTASNYLKQISSA